MSYDISYQAQVLTRLRIAFATALSSLFSGRVYWQKAPQEATLPYLVFQSQDGGGRRDDCVGENGWSGLITFRVIDDDQADADALLAQVPALLQGLSATVVPSRPLAIPPEEYPDRFLFTAAFIAECQLGV